jgi:hypothetical protein
MGVRISWLMLAKSCDLLQVASSAASLAAVLALNLGLKKDHRLAMLSIFSVFSFHHESTVLISAFEPFATIFTNCIA